MTDYEISFATGLLMIIIAAAIGIWMGLSKWFDNLMHKIGDFIDGKR